MIEKKVKITRKRKGKKKKKKRQIDLIEIDELDQLSFEDLNSNITLGSLDNSNDDPILDALTTYSSHSKRHKNSKKRVKNK